MIQGAFVVLLVVGVTIAVGGEVDVPELIALLILAIRFVEPLILSADVSGAIKVAGNALARADNLLATSVLPESPTPADGSVRFGEVSFGYHDDLMRRVSIEFQENYLFAGEIADNVRVARPDASEADLEAVAALVRLDEVVGRLPHGWHSAVGEGGTRLSGGERQRVTLARALLKDALVVVLD